MSFRQRKAVQRKRRFRLFSGGKYLSRHLHCLPQCNNMPSIICANGSSDEKSHAPSNFGTIIEATHFPAYITSGGFTTDCSAHFNANPTFIKCSFGRTRRTPTSYYIISYTGSYYSVLLSDSTAKSTVIASPNEQIDTFHSIAI